MEKKTKILVIVLACALGVFVIATTALAVALCMDGSHHDERPGMGMARGMNRRAPQDNAPFSQPPTGRDNRAGRGILGQELEKVASTLGMSPEELLSELKDDKTLAQIAGEKGVDTQTLVDTILEPVQKMLSNRVENGKITQEQADQKLQQMKTRVEDFINNGGPLRGLPNDQNEQTSQPSSTTI